MAKEFSPANPVEQSVYAGSYEAVIALLRGMSEADRKSYRAGLLRMLGLMYDARFSKQLDVWGGPCTDEQYRAARGAIILCGSARDVAEHPATVGDLIELAKEFQPSSLHGLAAVMMDVSPHRIGVVLKLIAAGVATRPDTDNFFLGLMGSLRMMPRDQTFDDVLASDPGLGEVLLRIMEIEGTSEFNLAAADKYSPARTWSSTLLRLCERGLFSRATLLDKTLGSLERDWPQFRSGWFSRFHEALSPSVEEMKPHTRRYLALCHSRIPPTVALALRIMEELDDAGLLSSRELLDALRPVMSSSVKGQVSAAIKLLERIVTRDASLAPESTLALVAGLAHESADVQKQILRRLITWGVNAELQRRLSDYAPGIAAANHKEFQQLTASADSASPASFRAEPANPSVPPAQIVRISILDPSRKLVPLPSDAELVECIAHVFENDTDIDSFERAIAGLVQAAPLLEASRARFGPVLRRAAKVRKPMARELARLLGFVATGTRANTHPSHDQGGRPSPVEGLLIARINDLMDLAAEGVGLPPLSTPTHVRGVIDPMEFVQRVAAYQSQGVQVPQSDQILGLRRLATGATGEVRARARTLRDAPLTRALRYALGDDLEPAGDLELFAVTACIRNPRTDPRYAWHVKSLSHEVHGKTYVNYFLEVTAGNAPDRTSADAGNYFRGPPRFGGIDEGTITYSATLLPSDLAAFFADGARSIGNNINWWEAEWQNSAYLRLLLDPTVEMTDSATLVLALGLAGKEPGQTAIAVDALVQAKAEARLDGLRLGQMMGELLITSLVKGARYAKSLRAALRIDADLASVIFDVLCAAFDALVSNPPKDCAVLLELMQEVMLISQRALPETTCSAIGKLTLGGKSRTLQRSLLETETKA